jgi:hypothetical protein
MRRLFLLLAVVLLSLLASQVFAAQLSGAIFTGLKDGAAVNKNIYDAKCDVYLIGGPGPNAPPTASGLPEGYYYFQVTDPSGKVLLSSDDIGCRRFWVGPEGYISAYAPEGCTSPHDYGDDEVRGYGVTIGLCPYDDTPNNGNVYKVWATPVDQYQAGAGVFGFIPAWSKTDNFKVKGGPTPPTITVRKFNDLDGDGVWDKDEPEITGWGVEVIDPSGASNMKYTPETFFAWTGSWRLIEDTPCDWYPTASILDGEPIIPVTTAVDVLVNGTNGGKYSHEVIFGNLELGKLKACKFYDRNGNGVNDDEPPVVGFKIVVTGVTFEGDPVEFIGYTGADGCVSFAVDGDHCGLLPGTYTITEVLPNGTWVNSTVLSYGPITLNSGDEQVREFGNYCTGTAAFGTKGYWHNRNGLTEMTDADIAYANGLLPYADPSSYFDDGDEPFDGFFQNGDPVDAAIGDGIWQGVPVAPEGTPRAEVSQFLVDANAGGDPREQLAQQLLAFIFNARNRLGDVSVVITSCDGTTIAASDLIADAIDAWESGTAEEQNAMASLLDCLNNSLAVPFIHYDPCDVSY